MEELTYLVIICHDADEKFDMPHEECHYREDLGVAWADVEAASTNPKVCYAHITLITRIKLKEYQRVQSSCGPRQHRPLS